MTAPQPNEPNEAAPVDAAAPAPAGKKRPLLAVGLLVLLVLAAAFVLVKLFGGNSTVDEGDCLSSLTKDSSKGYLIVDCDDPKAAFVITDKDTGSTQAKLDACDDDPGGTLLSGSAKKKGKRIYWEACAVPKDKG